MHVGLWAPGRIKDGNGNTLQLITTMCDLTQFVISIIVSDAHSEPLGKLFVEQVVFSFGMVHLLL